MPPICVDGTCDRCCPCSTLCHSNRFCRWFGRLGIRSCQAHRYRVFSIAVWVGFVQLLLCIYSVCALSPEAAVLRYTYWGEWSAVNETASVSNKTNSSIPETFVVDVRMGITHVAFNIPNRTEWSVNWKDTCEGTGAWHKWLSAANLCGDCEEDAYSLRYSVIITVLTSLTKIRVNWNRRQKSKDLPIWKMLGVVSCLVVNGCTIWSYHLLVHHCFSGMAKQVGTYQLSWLLGPGIFAELLVLGISAINGVLHLAMAVPEANLWCVPSKLSFSNRHARLLTLDSEAKRKMLVNDYSYSYTATSET